MKSKNSNNKKSLYTPYNNSFSSLGEREDLSMDWSEDTPVQTSSPLPCVPPPGELVPSPHVPVELVPTPRVPPPQGNNVPGPSRPEESAILLNYGNFQPVDPRTWDGSHSATSVFGTKESRKRDVHFIALSISRIMQYIKNNPIIDDEVPDVIQVIPEQMKILISTIYSSKWDLIVFSNKKKENTLNNYIKRKFTPKAPSPSNPTPPPSVATPPAPHPVANTSLTATSTVPPPSNKLVKENNTKTSKSQNLKKSYAQVSKANISQKVQASKVNIAQNVNKILRVQEAFPELSADDIGKIIKVTNDKGGQKNISL